MKPKILFLVAHRLGRSPGQRFRFEQYLDNLRENNFETKVSFLISEKDDKIFYANGKYIRKLIFVLKSLWIRWKDVKIARNYDIIFLYREAHMLGFIWFEKRLRKLGKKMVVDFDDSIWLNDISNGNRNLAFLKRPLKTNKIIALCDLCIVGNRYLADYALQFNREVVIIPTTIDTDLYPPRSNDNNADQTKTVIGWTGSSTTIKHFSLALPILQALRLKYGERVSFVLISDEPYVGHLEGLEFIKWNRSTEVIDLQKIDIGIMPLPDDAWAKGKCGFKGLQYMALEIPAVMSPVGVNTEIIDHGRNGYLASGQNEWVNILSSLIEDKDLRKIVGREGRKTVIEKFSYNSQKVRYIDVFRNLIAATK